MATPFTVPRTAGALCTLTLLLSACGSATGGEPVAAPTNLAADCVEEYEPGTDYFPDEVAFEHATGVEVSYTENTKLVEITRPWKGAAETFTVLLVQCGTPAPEDAEADLTVEVPVRRAATFSTTFLPAFDLVGRVDTLVAHGGLQYVSNETVREAADAGDVVEVGDQSGPDLERLLTAEPDLVLVSAGISGDDDRRRLADAGLPAVPDADWLEETWLGRAEWLKFVALFLNEEARAQEVFDEVEAGVEDVRRRAAEATERPEVLTNVPFEGVWYVPAGRSFIATALEELGANYPWSDTDGTGAVELDIEAVLAEAADADVWIGAGSVRGTLDDLAATDPRFREFDAFREGQVWADDRRVGPGGGNDIFELGAVRPDLVYRDLLAIVHPDLAGDVEMTFYGRVGELAG